MYRYFEPKDNDSFLIEDPIYRGLLRKLDELDIEDKDLFIKMISECYRKLHKSIKSKSNNDIELFYSLMMALLIYRVRKLRGCKTLGDN